MTEDQKMVDVPADLLALTCVPPIIRQVTVTCRKARSYEVRLPEPEPILKPGLQVVLDCGKEREIRMVGTITASNQGVLTLEVDRLVRRDKRTFPRMIGGIRMRYRVVAPAEPRAVGANHRENTDWHEPDPFMDFSASGLRFEDEARCGPGDLLLLELRLPPRQERWEATARVVRMEPIPEEEQGENGDTKATHWIALHFVDIPKDAVEALMDFTLRVQDAML